MGTSADKIYTFFYWFCIGFFLRNRKLQIDQTVQKNIPESSNIAYASKIPFVQQEETNCWQLHTRSAKKERRRRKGTTVTEMSGKDEVKRAEGTAKKNSPAATGQAHRSRTSTCGRRRLCVKSHDGRAAGSRRRLPRDGRTCGCRTVGWRRATRSGSGRRGVYKFPDK